MYDPAHNAGTISVGVVSDTHGHLYPQVRELLLGVEQIIHAGDIGSRQVLAGLRAIAPVTAVRGNCDTEAWALSLPLEAEVEVAGVRILVGHIAGRMHETLVREQSKVSLAGSGVTRPGFRVVISGHSHRVEREERDGVLYLNPGSAGPERFGHPRTIALLNITPAQDRAPAQVGVEFLVVREA